MDKIATLVFGLSPEATGLFTLAYLALLGVGWWSLNGTEHELIKHIFLSLLVGVTLILLFIRNDLTLIPEQLRIGFIIFMSASARGWLPEAKKNLIPFIRDKIHKWRNGKNGKPPG